MWDEKQKKLNCQGESMNSGFSSSEVSFMKSTKSIHSNNGSDWHFLDEASGKRKARDLDQGSNVYNGASLGRIGNFRGNPCYLPPGDSSLQHVIPTTQIIDSHWRTPEIFSNHNLQAAKPINVQSQFGNYHFHNMNSASVSLPTESTQFQEIAGDSSESCSFYYKESFLSFRTPTQELPMPTDSKQDEVATQSESDNVQSSYSKVGRCMEKTQVAFRSHIGMNMEHGNYDFPSKSYQCFMTSQNLQLLESSQLQRVEKKLNVDGGSNFQEFTKSGLFEAKKGDQNADYLKVWDISTGTTNSPQFSALMEGEKSHGSYQNPNTNIRCENNPCNDTLGVHLNVIPAESSGSAKVCLNYEGSKKSAHVLMDSGNRSLEKDDSTDTEKRDTSREEVQRSVKHGDPQPLNNLDEQIKSAAAKVPPATEKLWDGSLQLNTSTTVSAVAFFKSGEKAQDINWSEIVEIKGKVRLQAFEKFIQELPRSRNRALMVISLCWKVGSSRAGLTGMKEVAKVYKESERVGFAQICPGFDLYVCPRSDTIIMILAKHGFFKGMAAVEEDHNSLIGCVVWRRNHSSLSSAPKKLGKKKTSTQEQPLLSPESSTAEVNSPHTSEARSAADNATIMAPENNTTQLSNNLSNSISFKTKCGPGTTLSIPYNSPLIPAQPLHPWKPDSRSLQETIGCNENSKGSLKPMPSVLPGLQRLFPEVPPRRVAQKFDSSSQQDSIGSSSHSETHIIPFSESEKPVLGCEPAQTALPGPPLLPPEILQRLINSSRAAQKRNVRSQSPLQEPYKGIPKAEIPWRQVAEPKQAAMSVIPTALALPGPPMLLSTALNGAPGADVDDDLPEFDFNSACGVPEASASRYLQSYHHMKDVLSFNSKQLLSKVAKYAGGTTTPHELSSVKPRGSMPISQSSSFPGELLNPDQGMNQPAKFGCFASENKPAVQTSQPLMQPCTLNANKDSVTTSSNCSFSRRKHWDDDDDDMPEWCPPDLEHLNQPPLSPTTKLPSTVLKPISEIAAPHPSPAAHSPTSLFPPKGGGFHDGFQPGILGPRPASNNPAAAPVQTRPTNKFVHSSPRPPLVPSRDRFLGPRTSKSNIKPPRSNSGWKS